MKYLKKTLDTAHNFPINYYFPKIFLSQVNINGLFLKTGNRRHYRDRYIKYD